MRVFTIFSLLYYAVFVNVSVPHTLALLGVCAKLRKATASFVMHVSLSARPSVRPHGTTCWRNFRKILYFSIFRKAVEVSSVINP